MKPIARKTDLITQQVGDETLVYDSTDESARRLNRLSSAVWRHCTGENTVAQIAVLVAAEITLPEGADALEVVERALEELTDHGLLLEGGLAGAAPGADFARRDVMRALAAIPLFPSIDKIFAPTMANAASTPETSQTASKSASHTASNTATSSETPTNTPSNSYSATNSATASHTASNSRTASNSASQTRSASTTASRSRSASTTASRSRSASTSIPAPAPTPTLP